MKKIKSLQKHRWFIWAIVTIVASLVGLTSYIGYVSDKDSSEVTADLLEKKTLVPFTVTKVSLPVSKPVAITLVKNLPEVVAFKRRVPNAVFKAELMDKNKVIAFWRVQVAEELKDHEATFGWYNVYIKTGHIYNLNQLEEAALNSQVPQ
jgi:hypothetical protein